VLDLFDQLNVSGRTVVVITHEEEVAAHAKRVLRMRDGLILIDDRRAPVAGPPPRLRAGADTTAAMTPLAATTSATT
jgi:putative ABC transport system ATP-binding protein